MYHATNIDRNNFEIVMKYIFHSSYKLDPIEIESDEDVQCFMKEQFRVDSAHRSPLYIEVSQRVLHTNDQEKSGSRGHRFVSGSGSNKCSSLIPAVDHNRTHTTRAENEIPAYATVNLGDDRVNIDDRANMRRQNIIIPSSQEHEQPNNMDNDSVDYEDEVEDERIEHDFVPNDYVEAYERVGDVDLNATFEVPIMSEGLVTVVPIMSKGFTTAIPSDMNVRCGSLPVEGDVQTTIYRTSRSTSNHTSRATNTHSNPSTCEPSTLTPTPVSVSDDIEVGQICSSKRELQHKLGMYAIKYNYEFKVYKSCTQRFEVKCVDNQRQWRLRAARIEGLEFFSIRVLKNVHNCSVVNNLKSGHRQASSKLVGDEIKEKYDGIARQYRPKEIVFDIDKQHGVRITYTKAWRAK